MEAVLDALAAAFVRPARPALVPELELDLAEEITPVWEAVERVTGRTGTEPPFWAFCWAGGQALARWILDRPAVVHGRRVVDIGCGGGVSALAAARAGATRVTANDIDPLALAMVQRNAARNGLIVESLCGDLLANPPDGCWDVVLVGDVCYDRGTSARLVAWLQAHAAAGATVLLGDPGRKYRPDDGLVLEATYTVPTTVELESRIERATGVWRVLPA